MLAITLLTFSALYLPVMGGFTPFSSIDVDCNNQPFFSSEDVGNLVSLLSNNNFENAPANPESVELDDQQNWILTSGSATVCIGNEFIFNQNTHFSLFDLATVVSEIVLKCNGGGGEADSSVTGDTGTTLDVALTNTQFSSSVAACPFAFTL